MVGRGDGPSAEKALQPCSDESDELSNKRSADISVLA